MARKNIEVQYMKEFANSELERDDEWACQEYKRGICMMIERILHSSGNYSGFQYVAWVKGGCEKYHADKKTLELSGSDPELLDTQPYLGKEWDRVYY